jgi:hypothetical protein
MRLQPRYLTNAAGTLAAGLAAGVISISVFVLSEYWALLARRDDLVFYSPGAIFGVVISVYCWLFYSRRSILRSLAFIVICMATELAMIFLTIVLTVSNHSNPAWVTRLNPEFVWWIVGCFMAGTIGAFLVLLAAAFLLFTLRGAGRTLLAALCWSPIVGLLSVLGWAFGSYMSSRFAGVSAVASFEALFLAWQSGTGLALGLMFNAKRLRPEFDPKRKEPD